MISDFKLDVNFILLLFLAQPKLLVLGSESAHPKIARRGR